MSALLNLDEYTAYIDPERADFASALTLPFFEGCEFNSPVWHLRNSKNKGVLHTLEFDMVPLGPGYRLGDNPDLLRSVKLSCVFVFSGNKVLNLTKTSTAEGISDYHSHLISFLRYLDLHGLRDMQHVNQAVAEMVLNAYLTQTNEERLNLEERGISALEELFANPEKLDEFRKFDKGRRGSKPSFDYERFTNELGVSIRSLQSISSFQKLRLSLLETNGFSFKKYKGGADNTNDNDRSESAIRKPLTAIQAFLRMTHVLADIFPESQRTREEWLAGVKASKLALSQGRVSLVKTRNIPRNVFYKLMDEAIRWVIDYADVLIQYRDDMLKEHQRIYLGLSSKSKGTVEGNLHYASKQMVNWFRDNQPNGFPYSLSGIVRAPKVVKERSIDLEKVAEARSLSAGGLTLEQVAQKMGTHKSNIQRWLKFVPRVEGVSVNAAVYSYLVSACLLVIFAFTARRRDEVMGLKLGSIVESGGSLYLIVDQEKYNQGERPLPTIRLVQMAVQVLEKLSAKTPDVNGNVRLLRLNNLCSGKEQEAWENFNGFCEYTGISTKDEDGFEFSFADHQFRRFLAMTYWYRYPDADMPTLSWFLGHISTEMTMKYITDKDGQWEEALQVKNEFIQELLSDDRALEPSVVAEELKTQLGMLSAEKLNRAKLMEKEGELLNQYVVTFVKDGACFGFTSSIQPRSKCAVDGVAQISSMKEMPRGQCKGCPNLISVESPLAQSQVVSLSTSESPMLSALKQRSQEAEAIRV